MPPPKRTKKPPPRRGKAKPAVSEPTNAPPAIDHDTPDEPGEYGRVEVRRRVAFLLGAGYSPGLVVEQLMEQPIPPNPDRPQAPLGGFGVSRATGWRYVNHVRKKWETEEPEERPFQRARCIRMQEFGIRGAAEDRDWSAFNGGVKFIAELFGLRLSKFEVNEGGLDALIAALKATPAQRLDELSALRQAALDAGLDPDELLRGAVAEAGSDPGTD